MWPWTGIASTNSRPHKTDDYGATWTEIASGSAGWFTTVVRADPARRGLLYAGTDSGAFVSFDDGASWQPLSLNLPTAWVGDLAVHGNDLVAATQGRALWVLYYVTPLRQLSPEIAGEPVHLFGAAEAIRVRANENRDTPLPPEVPIAHNPPNGAVIDYVVGSGLTGPMTIEILTRAARSCAPSRAMRLTRRARRDATSRNTGCGRRRRPRRRRDTIGSSGTCATRAPRRRNTSTRCRRSTTKTRRPNRAGRSLLPGDTRSG